jgi:hypothetical protein
MGMLFYLKFNSKGLGDFFSSRAQVEQENKTRKDYLWKCENEPNEQKLLMIDLFIKKGFNKHDSVRIVDYLAENTRAFADVMLLEIGIFWFLKFFRRNLF